MMEIPKSFTCHNIPCFHFLRVFILFFFPPNLNASATIFNILNNRNTPLTLAISNHFNIKNSLGTYDIQLLEY